MFDSLMILLPKKWSLNPSAHRGVRMEPRVPVCRAASYSWQQRGAPPTGSPCPGAAATPEEARQLCRRTVTAQEVHVGAGSAAGRGSEQPQTVHRKEQRQADPAKPAYITDLREK